MPIGALVRIPTSLSRGGHCVTNLRGLIPDAPIDYINPSRSITAQNLSRGNSGDYAGSGNWVNTIRYTFQSNEVFPPSLTYPSLLSTATTGTLLFRMYLLTPKFSINPVQCLFKNGRLVPGSGSGYAVLLSYDASGETYILQFVLPGVGSAVMNTGPSMTYETWYTYGVVFDSLTSPGSTKLRIYENGTVIGSTTLDPMITPTTGTSLFVDGETSQFRFLGGITDFALLESTLTEDEILAFANAPYI